MPGYPESTGRRNKSVSHTLDNENMVQDIWTGPVITDMDTEESTEQQENH